MSDKVIRLFKIINAIQANPGISANDLAFKCDVHVRTIFRDMDYLELIAPVFREGHGTGYRFSGNFSLYPLNFTERNLGLLYVAFRY
jgi:predicted DNA-binding transcriptional regulator YafY